jgi:hypothetical protein
VLFTWYEAKEEVGDKAKEEIDNEIHRLVRQLHYCQEVD